MPIYQPHVSEPDYAGYAAAYKPFDLAATVEASMRFANEMTMEQQKIQSNATQIALDQQLAPMKVARAKIEMDRLQKENQVFDLVNAPDQIQVQLDAKKAKAQAEKADSEFKVKQLNDTIALQTHQEMMNDLARTAKDHPELYLTKRAAVVSVLGNNSAFNTFLQQLDNQFDESEYADKDRVLQKGSYIRAHPELAGQFSAQGGMSRAELADAGERTKRETERGILRSQRVPEETINAMFAARDQEVKTKAEVAQKYYENFSEMERLTGKQVQRRLESANLPAGAPGEKRFQEDTGISALVGESSISAKAIHGLASIKSDLEKQVASGVLSPNQVDDIQRRIQKIDAVMSQSEQLRIYGTDLFAPFFILRKMKGAASMLYSQLVDGVDGSKEFAELSRIVDMEASGDGEGAYRNMIAWLNDFELNKSMTQIERRNKILKTEMEKDSVAGIIPSAGPIEATGGITREAAAKLPKGTKFTGVDGKEYVR